LDTEAVRALSELLGGDREALAELVEAAAYTTTASAATTARTRAGAARFG
jgi:hypothetical protein